MEEHGSSTIGGFLRIALDREKCFLLNALEFLISGSSTPATSRTPPSAPDAAKEGDTWLDWLFTHITKAWSWGGPRCCWPPPGCSGLCRIKRSRWLWALWCAAHNQLCRGPARSIYQLTVYNAFYELLFCKCCYVSPFFNKDDTVFETAGFMSSVW